jgi:hypothetical protein
MFNVWPIVFFCFIFQERIIPSQEPTLPPLIYSSPSDDAVDARRPSEEYSPNERNAYDLVMPGVVETGLLIFYLFLIFFIRVFYFIKRDVIETIFSFNWCKQRFNTLYNTRNFWSSSLHLAFVQFLNVTWWYVKEKFDIINLTY